MRAPLDSTPFFVKQIINFLKCLRSIAGFEKVLPGLEQSIKDLHLVKVQLKLMKTFLRDLLDARNLKEGHFTLKETVFDPNKTFTFVCNMLEKKAKSRGV